MLTPITLYTLGYSGWNQDELRETVERLDAVLVDIRFKPYSRNAQFNKKALTALFGDRYRWVRELGNVNYKGGPVQLVDAKAGAIELQEIAESHPPILMCMCKDVSICHRKKAANLLKNLCGWKVVHLTRPAQPTGPVQEALF